MFICIRPAYKWFPMSIQTTGTFSWSLAILAMIYNKGSYSSSVRGKQIFKLYGRRETFRNKFWNLMFWHILGWFPPNPKSKSCGRLDKNRPTSFPSFKIIFANDVNDESPNCFFSFDGSQEEYLGKRVSINRMRWGSERGKEKLKWDFLPRKANSRPDDF